MGTSCVPPRVFTTVLLGTVSQAQGCVPRITGCRFMTIVIMPPVTIKRKVLRRRLLNERLPGVIAENATALLISGRQDSQIIVKAG